MAAIRAIRRGVLCGLLAGCGGSSPLAETPRAEAVHHDSSFRDDEIRVALAMVSDELASCVPFSSEPFPIDVLVSPDGHFARDPSTLMSASTAACLDGALARGHMPRTAPLGRMITIDVAEPYRTRR